MFLNILAMFINFRNFCIVFQLRLFPLDDADCEAQQQHEDDGGGDDHRQQRHEVLGQIQRRTAPPRLGRHPLGPVFGAKIFQSCFEF